MKKRRGRFDVWRDMSLCAVWPFFCGSALECGGSTPLSLFLFFFGTASRLTREEKKESGVEPPHSKALFDHFESATDWQLHPICVRKEKNLDNLARLKSNRMEIGQPAP